MEILSSRNRRTKLNLCVGCCSLSFGFIFVKGEHTKTLTGFQNLSITKFRWNNLNHGFNQYTFDVTLHELQLVPLNLYLIIGKHHYGSLIAIFRTVSVFTLKNLQWPLNSSYVAIFGVIMRIDIFAFDLGNMYRNVTMFDIPFPCLRLHAPVWTKNLFKLMPLVC